MNLSPKASVLLVEDEPSIRKIFRDLLSHEGYEVWEAEDGEIGLRFAQNKPDLVLLDLVLPKVNGWEVCRRIRNSPATQKTPIIVFSMLDGEQESKRAMECGATAYMVKGSSRLREILTKINELLPKGDKQ